MARQMQHKVFLYGKDFRSQESCSYMCYTNQFIFSSVILWTATDIFPHVAPH